MEETIQELAEMLGLEDLKGYPLYTAIINEVTRLNLIERWTEQEMDYSSAFALDKSLKTFLEKFGY